MSTAHAHPAPARNGLYGPPGWLDDLGVLDLLSPLLCHPPLSSDFGRFEGAGAEECHALLDLLPMDNLNDRQNNGPRLSQVLAAAIRWPGIEVSGYIVRSPRWDERISVDGMLVPALRGLPRPRAHDPLAFDSWPDLCTALELSSARGAPDEFQAVPIGHDRFAWWIWWD